MRRILVIQLRELGDSILTTPAIRQLRRIHPEAEIDVLCEPRSDVVFRANPHVRESIYLRRGARLRDVAGLITQLRKRRYDLVVDSQSLPKTAVIARLTGAPRRVGFHHWRLRNRLTYTHPYRRPEGVAEYMALSKLKLLQDPRVDPADLRLDYMIRGEEREEAELFRRRWFRGPVAALYVVCRFDHRCWPVEKFAQIGDRLGDRGIQSLLVYGPGQEERAQEVARRMRYKPIVDYPMIDFSVLKGVMEGCCLFMGNDGGPKHIATACNLPSVTLFGQIHPEFWNEPDAPAQRFLATRSDTRAIPTIGPCTNAATEQDIEVDAVWNAIVEQLDRSAMEAA